MPVTCTENAASSGVILPIYSISSHLYLFLYSDPCRSVFHVDVMYCLESCKRILFEISFNAPLQIVRAEAILQTASIAD